MNLTLSLCSACTLNELRTWLELERETVCFFFVFVARNSFLLFYVAFKSFEDWNAYPEIANAARELYGDIDRLELYPGLHAEGHAENGYGQKYSSLRVNTVRFGLLFDAIALVWPFFLFFNTVMMSKKYRLDPW
jgi:hypothetical protein